VLAARDKTLISRAMDNVARTVAAAGDDESAAGGGASSAGRNGEIDEEEAEAFEVDGRLIALELTHFRLSTPSPMPAYLNVHFICETASRLLFLSVHWVRSIPAFSMLRLVHSLGSISAKSRSPWVDLAEGAILA